MVHTASGYARMRNRLGALVCTTLDRARRDEHGHRRRARDGEPAAGAAAARRRLRLAPARPGAAAARGAVGAATCRSTTASGRSRATSTGSGGPSRWSRPALQAMRVLVEPGRDRRGHARLPAGRAGRGVRLSRGASSRKRVWHVRAAAAGRGGARATRRQLIRASAAAADRRRRRRHLLARRPRRCARLCERPASRSARRRRARARCRTTTRRRSARSASTGTFAANRIAAEADLVIGVGTRWSDFTTASKTAFRNPDVRFVNVNVADFDAAKHAGARARRRRARDARAARRAARRLGGRRRVPRRGRARSHASGTRRSTRLYTLGHAPLPAQSEVHRRGQRRLGADATSSSARPASMPGDLHKLWRTRDPKGYHVEYGYSCMGYEIAGGLGVKMAAPEREVYVLVGDGSYLMLSSELVTAVQEGLKLTIVLVDNHGFNSIGGALALARHRRLRHAVPAPAERLAGARQRALGRVPAGRSRGERRVARRARDPRRLDRRAARRARSGEGRGADDGDRDRGRPLRGRAGLRELVGRRRRRGLRASRRCGRARGVRGARREERSDV